MPCRTQLQVTLKTVSPHGLSVFPLNTIQGGFVADERTPEQKAADEHLIEAIAERFRVYELMASDEVVEQYIVSAYVTGLDLIDRNSAKYCYAVRDSGEGPYSVPVHSLQGLIVRAHDWLANDDRDDG